MAKHIYIPVLKGKVNDLCAFARMDPALARVVKPLVDVPPVPKEMSVDQYVDKFAHHLLKHVNDKQMFVDFYGFQPNQNASDGTNAVVHGLRRISSLSLPFTPTYGFERNDEIWSEIGAVVKKQGRGFCFRVDIDDLDDMADETWVRISERTSELGLPLGSVDVAVDLRDVRTSEPKLTAELVEDFLSLNPALTSFRSVAILGSSALKSVSEVETDGHLDVVRNEIKLWAQLQSVADVDLTYGDYGVVHPDFSDQVRNLNVNAKIRYTSRGRIHYYRGHGLLRPVKDYGQYFDLAETVRSSSIYEGPESSFGDWYIDAVADHARSQGNLGTWVLADTNHHLTHTARQVSLLAPSIKTTSNVWSVPALN